MESRKKIYFNHLSIRCKFLKIWNQVKELNTHKKFGRISVLLKTFDYIFLSYYPEHNATLIECSRIVFSNNLIRFHVTKWQRVNIEFFNL